MEAGRGDEAGCEGGTSTSQQGEQGRDHTEEQGREQGGEQTEECEGGSGGSQQGEEQGRDRAGGQAEEQEQQEEVEQEDRIARIVVGAPWGYCGFMCVSCMKWGVVPCEHLQVLCSQCRDVAAQSSSLA